MRYYNVSLEPHIAALLFLGSAGLLVLLAMATAVLLLWRRQWLRYSLGGIAVIVVGYGALLLAFSLFSRQQTLARGEEKYFCELDCHLAYSVQNVERVKTIGDTAANGQFYVVTLRTRFDETTIAPWRGDRPLVPSPLDIRVVDDQGQTFQRSSAGQTAWEAEHGPSRLLLDCLRPGEAYETPLVFDVPAEPHLPRLLVADSGFPIVILIGDESSLLHKKTYLGL